MKKISLIAALALGGLLACCTMATAQDAKSDSSTNSPAKGSDSAPKKGKRGMLSVEQRMERMTDELSLTDEQKPKIKAVLEDSDKQFKGLADLSPEERRPKVQSIREDEGKKIKEILTPDQWEKYQTMMQSMGKKKRKQSSE